MAKISGWFFRAMMLRTAKVLSCGAPLAVCLMLVAIFFMGEECAFAAGDPTECKVTVKQVFLKTVSGSWVLVKKSEREADLMAEEPILSFINYDRVPPGKYVNFKIVLSETVKVSGRDGGNMTREGGEIIVGGTAAKASDLPGDIASLKTISPTWNDQKPGAIIEHLNLDFEDSNDTMEIYPKRNFQKPFIVKKGSAVHIWLTVNLNHTIYFAFPNSIQKGVPKVNSMYFIPPSTIDDVSLISDSVSKFASEAEVAFDF